MPKGPREFKPGSVTDLQSRRIVDHVDGRPALCGSPLAGGKIEGNKNYGKTCKRRAGAGTDHYGYGNCSWHAGNMPSSKKAAANEQASAEVQRARVMYGTRVEGLSFEEALMEEMQRSVGIVRWLEERIGIWDMPDLAAWKPGETNLPPMMQSVRGPRNVVVTDSEQAQWLKVYLAERRHLVDLCKVGISTGIAKSIIELQQRQADAMYQIINRALDVLAPGSKDRLPSILPAIVREVTGRSA